MPNETSQTVVVLTCRSLANADQDGNEEDLGLIELAYLVYDRCHDKIISSLEKIVPPVLPENKESLQQSTSYLANKSELGKGEDIREILQQLDTHLEKKPVYVVTDGPTSLRHNLHPHANRTKTKLHETLYSYFDVGIEFKRNYPEHGEDCTDILQLASHLNIDLSSTTQPHGLQLCRLILEVMQQLPFDGCRQVIQSQYSSTPSTVPFVEDSIVRARGFSPSTTDVKLARFFSGLNIESGGIIMCPYARQPPEALVRFTDKEQRDLALKRNGTKFGTRHIEICPATIQEYTNLVNQDNIHCSNALENFLLMAAPPVVIIRMRGLPYNTKASEIVTFFADESPVYRGTNGVFFVYHPDRRPTGDAFVLFETVEHQKKALTKDRQTIGKRYVELFPTTVKEVAQVATRYSLPNNGLPFQTVRPIHLPDHVIQNKNYFRHTKNIIRLRGLPYSATVQDILDFLSDFSKYVNTAGVHMVYNLQGRPSGDAFIEMRSADHAQKASESLHKKHIGERYIEVFQCSHSEMNFMLMHGIPTYRHQHNAWVNGPYSPHTPPHVPTAFTYPPVSSPTTVPSNSPHMMSVPSSPTLSPSARVFVTSPSHGYVSYSSPPYNVFNFSYPTSNMPVEVTGGMAHTQPIVSPAPYDSTVFFPGYQPMNNDYHLGGQMDPVYIPVNPYLPPTNGYYQSGESHTDSGHIPAYIETHSG